MSKVLVTFIHSTFIDSVINFFNPKQKGKGQYQKEACQGWKAEAANSQTQIPPPNPVESSISFRSVEITHILDIFPVASVARKSLCDPLCFLHINMCFFFLFTVQGIMGCRHWHTSLGSVAMELRWPAAMAGKGTAREYVKVIFVKIQTSLPFGSVCYLWHHYQWIIWSKDEGNHQYPKSHLEWLTLSY